MSSTNAPRTTTSSSSTAQVAPPIPILYVVHSLGHGGMERQLAALVCGLDRTRFEPHVAYVIDGFRADEIKQRSVPLIQIPIINFWKPGPFALAKFLAEYIRRHKIRIVHLFDAGLGFVTALAARRSSGTLLLTSQRSFMSHLPRWHRYFLLFAHWMGHGAISNSFATRSHLSSLYRYPSDRIEVCYNGLPSGELESITGARLDSVQDAAIVLGCVCVLRPEKNLVQLIEVFARVRREIPQAKLLLMGSGPEETVVRNKALELGVESGCVFLPSAANVAAAFRSIDIFIHPSITESLPNSLMEAMAFGCCVVATRVGGCAELIESGVHGILVESRDIGGMTEQVLALIKDPVRRRQLAVAGKRRIEEEFSLEESLRHMQAIYSKAVVEARKK